MKQSKYWYYHNFNSHNGGDSINEILNIMRELEQITKEEHDNIFINGTDWKLITEDEKTKLYRYRIKRNLVVYCMDYKE